MPSDFPSVPPKVWFMNHGGVRFNPNLYDYGKYVYLYRGLDPVIKESHGLKIYQH